MSRLSDACDCRVIRWMRTVVVLAAVAGGFGFSASVSGQDSTEVKIGALLPLSGGNAVIGNMGKLGVSMAVKEINDAGGVMGRKINLVFGDDGGEPAQSVAEARRLTERENIKFLVGPASSTLALADAPVLNAAKVPAVHMAGATAITPKVMPYGFSMFAPIDASVSAMVQYAADVMKVKSAAVFTDGGALGLDSQNAFRRQLAERNIQLTGVQQHEIRTNDMMPQILSLRRGNPDVILFVTTTGEDGGLLVKTLNDIGWNVRVVSPIFTNVMGVVMKVAGPDTFKSGNLAGITYKSFTYCAGDPLNRTPYAQLLQRLKAADPQNFDKLILTVISFMYDAVYVFKAAAEGARSFDGDKIAAWLEQNAGSINGRASGQLTASPDNHFLIRANALAFATRPDVRREDGLVQRAGC